MTAAKTYELGREHGYEEGYRKGRTDDGESPLVEQRQCHICRKWYDIPPEQWAAAEDAMLVLPCNHLLGGPVSEEFKERERLREEEPARREFLREFALRHWHRYSNEEIAEQARAAWDTVQRGF